MKTLILGGLLVISSIANADSDLLFKNGGKIATSNYTMSGLGFKYYVGHKFTNLHKIGDDKYTFRHYVDLNKTKIPYYLITVDCKKRTVSQTNSTHSPENEFVFEQVCGK